MSDQDDDNERVGYGRPPKHSQFKPGQSGNPKGRPRGARGMNELISAELNGFVTVMEGGRRRKIRRREALAKRQVAAALAGTKEAIAVVLSADRQMLETLNKVASALVSEQDDLTRASLMHRIQAILGAPRAADDETSS